MHIGESTMEIMTEADINNITETANPLHDKPNTGMFGFLWCYTLNIYLSQLSVYVLQVSVPQHTERSPQNVIFEYLDSNNLH